MMKNAKKAGYILLPVTLLLVQLLYPAAEEPGERIIARVLGREIRLKELNYDPDFKREDQFFDSVTSLVNLTRDLVFQDYKKKNNLEATESEIREYFESVGSVPGDKYREALLSDPAERDRAKGSIECWKLCRALYERYGGAVAATKVGPDPVGAIVSLLRDYQKKGLIEILVKSYDRAFWKWLSRKPRYTLDPEDVDFTPNWKR